MAASTMGKIYLLLRNNKQTGPHTLEELAQLTLKPSDLIWVEGKSAGWRYPAEIDELKPHLPITDAVPQQKIKEAKHILNEPITQLETIIQKNPPGKEKATSDKRIYISLPGTLKVSDIHQSSAINSKGQSEEAPKDNLKVRPATIGILQENFEAEDGPQLSFDERVEKMRQRALNFSESKIKKQKNEPDIKYSRSLDDIKAEYSGWLQEQKRGKKLPFTRKHVAIALGSFVLLAIGFSIVKWLSRDTELQPPKATYNLPYLSDSAQDQKALEYLNKKPVNASQKKNQNGASLTRNIPTGTVKSIKTREEERAGKIAKAASIKQRQKLSEVKTNNKRDENQPANNIVDTQTPSTSRNGTTVGKKERPYIPLARLISISSKEFPGERKQGLGGYEVTVKNNSDKILNVVAVDVFYFNKNEKLVYKETLYFSNLQPRRSLTIAAGGHKRAVTASSQLGLISSGGSLYYAKQ
ncbi:MAG: DUF4339 domain-containing protein [Chitinophagaceae bacterium]